MSDRPKSDVGPSRSPHRPGTGAGRQARLLTRPSPHPLPTSTRHPRPATSPSTPTPAHPGRAHDGAHVEFAMGSGSSCHPQAVRRRDVTRFGWVADPQKGRRAFSPSAAEDGSVSPAPGRRESPPGEPSGDPRARPLSSLQQARRFPLRRGDSRTGRGDVRWRRGGLLRPPSSYKLGEAGRRSGNRPASGLIRLPDFSVSR